MNAAHESVKRPTEVAAAVIVRDATVLLTRRGPGRHMAGHWEFPGGTVEAEETVFECIEREISEELSLIVRPLRIYAENEHRYETTTIRLIAVLAEIVSGSIELSAHDDHAWIPI